MVLAIASMNWAGVRSIQEGGKMAIWGKKLNDNSVSQLR